MATTTTPNMGIVKPNPQGTASPQPGPTYAQDNDAALDTIDAHDHAAGNGVLVPVAGLNINSDLALTGFDLTDVDAVVMDGQGTIDLAKTRSVQFDNTSDGEVHIVDGQGRDIQLTNAGGLNTSLVGGITGDYSTSNADLEYDDTAKAYELKQDESPDHWANVKAGEIHVHEPASGIVTAAKIKSPLTLASTSTLTLGTVDVTLPTALPAATEAVSMTAAGELVSDGAHGPRTMNLAPSAGSPDGDTLTWGNNFLSVHERTISLTSATVGWSIPVPLRVGDRVTEIRVRVDPGAGATGTARWEYVTFSTGLATNLASASSSGTAVQTLTLNPADHTIAAGELHTVQIILSAGAATVVTIIGIEVDYDRP